MSHRYYWPSRKTGSRTESREKTGSDRQGYGLERHQIRILAFSRTGHWSHQNIRIQNFSKIRYESDQNTRILNPADESLRRARATSSPTLRWRIPPSRSRDRQRMHRIMREAEFWRFSRKYRIWIQLSRKFGSKSQENLDIIRADQFVFLSF